MVNTINTKNKKIIEIEKNIRNIVFSHKGILQLHGFYLEEDSNTISFDIIIDFKIKEKEETYKQIYDEIKQKYNDYKISITLDADLSD